MEANQEAHDSFAAWVAARRDRLLRSTYLLSGDAHQAEDLLQDALIKVARRWGRLEDGNPDAYIRRVIYHQHVSWWRSRRELPFAEILGYGDDGVDRRIRGLVVEQALARLTAKQRAVLVLRYFEDVTERDAAEALGVSVGTVKSQCAAALRRLKEDAPELRALIEIKGDQP